MNGAPRHPLSLALDPSRLLAAQGLEADPWQRALLACDDRQVLLNCSRQAGKSTTVAALALHTALFQPNALVLLLSPGMRQSAELLRRVVAGYEAAGRPVAPRRVGLRRLELANGSRVLSLPGKEETVRGFSPALVIIDEAARVPDALYGAVRPMLAVTRGRLLALSTPFGQRGWFHREWTGTGPWRRVQVTWRECPRITAEFVDEERRALGDSWVQQEYECLFTALEGLVYPDFVAACESPATPPTGKPVGGIDWGWRNPFAAVWGVLDNDDVLWILHERYLRQTPLHEHAASLPREVTWYCDPAGRTEREEFRAAGHTIRAGRNDLRLGIAAVTARLRTGRLRVDPQGCPNLIAEAQLYRYPTASERALLGENPIDAHNHALAALRYLVSRLDARQLARRPGPVAAATPPAPRKPRSLLHDESVWTRVF